MSTAIEGFGKQALPATSFSQPPFSVAQTPAGPTPPSSIVQSALQDSPLTTDVFTPSQAATILSSQTPDAVQEFEQNQAPPPYTLSNAIPQPNKINSKPLYAPPLTAFQVRQFDDLLKTVRSITNSVLPNFSYSA